MSEREPALGEVGIVGAGTMGAGIAQVALEAGHEVVLHDVDEAALAAGRARIRDGLSRRAARHGLHGTANDAWVEGHLARLRDAHSLDLLGAEPGLELVIEAAIEDLELKRTILGTLDAATEPDTLLATNTSALSVGAIAGVAEDPGRVLGLHFFNPAPVMALVEVVRGPATDPDAVERAVARMRAWGKTPVVVADAPGFIVNRVNRPFTIEALRLLETGAADIATIDAAMRAAGFPMGPFELIDLAGVDVNLAAARGVHEGLGRPERLRPSPIQERLVEEGRLGRKTGLGFYAYDELGRRGEPGAGFEALPDGGPASVAAVAIVERIRAAIREEADRAVAEGVASREDVELALRLGAGHPVGPWDALPTSLGA